MTYYYSPTARGFYTDEIHDTMPDDAIELTDDYYQSLMSEQSSGNVIVMGTNGLPITQAPTTPALTLDQAKSIRNSLLSQSDWTQLPDIPGSVNRSAWATYRQAVRNILITYPDPTKIVWPIAPGSSTE